MGVIIKYVIEFPGADFKVSNDLLRGDFIIDASVEVSMKGGDAGGKFQIELYDLPEGKAGELYKNGLAALGKKEIKIADIKKARVVIKLGYMDGDFNTVMEGVYTEVTADVKGDNLVTTIKGQESAIYALRNTRFQKEFKGKLPFKKIVTDLLKDVFPDSGGPAAASGILASVSALLGNGASNNDLIDNTPDVQKINVELEDKSMKGKSLMDILNDLTDKADAEFLVCDKKIHIGKPITIGPTLDEFDRDVNLAEFKPFRTTVPSEVGNNRLEELPPIEALGFDFVITGNPHLRPAQQVFANVETKINGEDQGYRKKDGGHFRIVDVTHSLSMTGGYVCKGRAIRTCTDDNFRRQQDVLCSNNADTVVQNFFRRTKKERSQNPTVEIGTIKEYNAGNAGAAPHRATLYFNQRFAKTETQPSIRAEVDKEEDQLFRNKPIVSPFAWHKCGLVVPVYPGMKALLSHNLGLADDALVTGFLWSEKPALEPPKSEEGDWWLCLPVDFDNSNLPTDSTKAANDLTTNKGNRVIEVKGLKITIGKDKLASVGTRPTPGEDDEFLIEHKSGTKFQISSDGSLSIEASKVSIKGDVTIEGNVEIK